MSTVVRVPLTPEEQDVLGAAGYTTGRLHEETRKPRTSGNPRAGSGTIIEVPSVLFDKGKQVWDKIEAPLRLIGRIPTAIVHETPRAETDIPRTDAYLVGDILDMNSRMGWLKVAKWRRVAGAPFMAPRRAAMPPPVDPEAARSRLLARYKAAAAAGIDLIGEDGDEGSVYSASASRAARSGDGSSTATWRSSEPSGWAGGYPRAPVRGSGNSGYGDIEGDDDDDDDIEGDDDDDFYDAKSTDSMPTVYTTSSEYLCKRRALDGGAR